VYNRYGRRDNKYKARIKILVKAIGAEKFAAEVEEEWKFSKDGPGTLTQAEFDRVAQYFQPPPTKSCRHRRIVRKAPAREQGVRRWVNRNVHAHKVPGYASVTLSTKPGPASPRAMPRRADGRGGRPGRPLQLRRTARGARAEPGAADVKKRDLFALWEARRRPAWPRPTSAC
jgi:sulfite reductase (NADPH) hemoprotein beta-component